MSPELNLRLRRGRRNGHMPPDVRPPSRPASAALAANAPAARRGRAGYHVAYKFIQMHNSSENEAQREETRRLEHGHTGRGRGRQRLRGRRTAPPARRPPGPGDRRGHRRLERGEAGHLGAPAPGRPPGVRRPRVRGHRSGPASGGRTSLHGPAARRVRGPGGRSARHADHRPVRRFPARRRGGLAAVLRHPLLRPLGVRPARTPGGQAAYRRCDARRRPRLLRHHVDPRARPAARGRPRRPRRHRDRRRLWHLGRGPLAAPGPARQRGDGQHVRVQGGRRPPAHPGDRAGSVRSSQQG